jgi:hypothetical protein
MSEIACYKKLLKKFIPNFPNGEERERRDAFPVLVNKV